MNNLLKMLIKSWRHFFMSLIGTGLLGVVVACLTKANLGLDPFSSFVTGLGVLFHSSYQTFFFIVTGVFLVIVFFWDKSVLGINTIINLLIIGNIEALVYKPLDVYFPNPVLWQRAVFLLAALLVLCVASSLYIEAGLGVSSYDAISIIGADKTKFQWRYCRILCDLLCCIIGFLANHIGDPSGRHSVIGVGTIITAFFMGPFTQWCRDHIAKPMLKGNCDS